MNIMISGGAGFIGSHLVGKLVSMPDVNRVVVYDNFSSGTRAHLADFTEVEKLEVIEGDLLDMQRLRSAMRGIEQVFHLAANPDIAAAVTDPDIDFRQGTILTRNLLEAMRLEGSKEIFYSSGSGVYGENPEITFQEDYGPCFPISTYGASKLACEALISSYCQMFGLRGRACRFANVVGPRQTHGVGYDFLHKLRNNSKILKILGDGSQLKSYIHVDDIINALLLLRQDIRSGKAFDVFNVSTTDQLTVKEIADMACQASGLSPERVIYDYGKGARGWKGDVAKVKLNSEKIRSHGWKCHRNSKEAVMASLQAMQASLGEE